ncbi:uncharacterized protein LOC106054897 isoform X3 [Biomphalaria glabrata]|uniref:Uncharacterized protein LOC106054897 isoform X3 n=1 Tax=Biomphalaria glabrata TaxID=6526 RepID=A0A9W2YDS1_BIOGL|nr:uncharacterized protein LOC106054897 isoform X3 [Biomphalaria glabrata]
MDVIVAVTIVLIYTVPCLCLSEFKLLTDLSKTIQPLNITFICPSSLKCGLLCVQDKSRCLAFIYDSVKSSCSLGAGVISTSSNRTSTQQVYWIEQTTLSTPRSCPSGYDLVTTASTSSCVLVITETMTFEAARKKCVDKGGHQYTMKSKEKMQFLETLHGEYWVGLKAVDLLGNYAWTDDNSPLQSGLLNLLQQVGCLNATKFIVLTDLNKSLLILNKTYTSPTQTNCAMRCASHGTQCRAFIYFRFNSTCVLGSGFVVTDPPRADVPQLFWVPRIECPRGFTPIELESESLCIKQSNEDFNFREAQSYCVDYNTSNQCVYFASPSQALVATTCSDTFSVVCEI